MSGSKNFIDRWSRRKQDSAAKRAPSTSGQADAKPSAEKSPAAAEAPPAKEFDPATLPPVDSIVAGSDIRAFLQTGVPPALTHAALRRAWSADPAIRDFVGLSENSWDFNAPDSIPGFGSLGVEDLRKLASKVLDAAGDGSASAERHSLVQSPSPPPETKASGLHEMQRLEPDPVVQTSGGEGEAAGADSHTRAFPPALQRTLDGAAQYNRAKEEIGIALARPRHGKALPE